MSADPSVRLIGVQKTFPDGTTALKEVTLDVADGEFFAVLGPSGSGKSTMLRIIGGFELASAGSVIIGGADMQERPPFQRDVNTVFQSYALFPHLDVFGNVAFGLRMAKVPRRERAERVVEALESVQLRHLARRRINELSGGERQRVALARALVKRPSVLLLDEPLGALDLKLRQEMQLELKAIQEEVGITFIHVTHDQDEAMALADRIAIMHAGEVAQVGRPADIYEDPASSFVAQFIGRVNLLSGTVAGGDSNATEVDVPELGRVVAAGSAPAGRGEIVDLALRPERIGIAPLSEATPGSANSFAGQVRRSLYGGSEILYEVELPGDRAVEVLVSREELAAQGELEAGTEVRVSWTPEAVVALPQSANGSAA